MSLSQNIRKYRLEKDLTQEQLACLLGVSAQAVSKWETSETYPDGALLVSIAEILGVSLDVLFDHRMNSMEDISERIQRLIKDTPRESGFIWFAIFAGRWKKVFSSFPNKRILLKSILPMKYAIKINRLVF